MKDKRRKKGQLDFPGAPFDPIDNDYPHNKQIILPGNYQNTFETFGMFGVNLINDPYADRESPEKSDGYLNL